MPQLVQRNRRRSPIVRGDQGSESIDDSSITPPQTEHGRLKFNAVISWANIWAAGMMVNGTLTIRCYQRIVLGLFYRSARSRWVSARPTQTAASKRIGEGKPPGARRKSSARSAVDEAAKPE
jgi:hypothetical protein